MSRAAEPRDVGRTDALAPRARLVLLTPVLLAVIAFIGVAAEASVPRTDAFASLGEGAVAGAPREVASLRSLTNAGPLARTARSSWLAPSALALAEPESGLPLFAGDELALSLGQDLGHRANASRLALGLDVEDLGGVEPALASRARDRSFHPLQDLELLADEPARGPPGLGEDLRQELAVDGPETRIGGSGLFLGSRIGERERLSLGAQWGCGPWGWGDATDQPQDPWGLADAATMAAALEEAARRGLTRPGFGGGSTRSQEIALNVALSPVTATLRTGESSGELIEYVRQQSHEPLIETNPAKARARVAEGMKLVAGTVGDVAVVGGAIRWGSSALKSGLKAIKAALSRVGEVADTYLPMTADDGIFGGGFGKLGEKPLRGSGGPGKVYEIPGEELTTKKPYLGKTRRPTLEERMADADHRAKTATGKPPKAQLLAEDLTTDEAAGVEALMIEDAGLENLTNKIPGLNPTLAKNARRIEAGRRVLENGGE